MSHPKHLIHFSVSIHCLRNRIPCSYQCYSPSNSTWCKYDDLMRQHVRQAMAKKGQILKTQIAVESRHVSLPLRGSLSCVFLFDRLSIHHSPQTFPLFPITPPSDPSTGIQTTSSPNKRTCVTKCLGVGTPLRDCTFIRGCSSQTTLSWSESATRVVLLLALKFTRAYTDTGLPG